MTLERVGAVFSGAVGLLTIAAVVRASDHFRDRNKELAANTRELRRQTSAIEKQTLQLDRQTHELAQQGELVEALGDLMFALNPQHDPTRGVFKERTQPYAIDNWKKLVERRAGRS